MDSRKFLLVILMIALVDADCYLGTQTCLGNYLANVQADGTRLDLLCDDVELYVKCMFSQGCDINSSAKQQIIDSTKSYMAPLHCNFTMEDLINRYGNENSASLLSPINTTLITIMSFILLIKNCVF